MKVLQISYKVPFPLTDGGAVSVYHCSLGLLSNGAGLTVLAADQATSPGDLAKAPENWLQATSFTSVPVDNRVKTAGALINLFTGRSYFSARFYSSALDRTISEMLQQQEYDIIQLEHLYLCEYLPVIRKHSSARVILRAQNIEHRIWARYLTSVRNPLAKWYLKIQTRRLEAFERKSAGLVDGIIALSEQDLEWFKSSCPGIPVRAIPIGMDIPDNENSVSLSPGNEVPVFYHLGSMDWRPNDEGLRWFIREILPAITRNYPEFRMRMAGKKMPPWYFQQQSAHLGIDGQIEDAAAYQSDKDVLIVPLLSGSGIRVKILEAMALGKAVISTSRGAEGLPVKHRHDILIADTPEEFVRCAGECISTPSLCKTLGNEARETVRKHFGIPATGEAMKAFYVSLCPESK
ncbi:MAG TPA: glycosyltransferase family 4 protein [Bacteroidales bacterium]|nr:glycosyltransferase family 4 protein [Bacteroidales bacterium]HRZ48549.1 glycosyltransferase family 4 protein [Bacteroidales bacterium]